MTGRERARLLFGPYHAPPLKRGDRATCLFHDCLVVVTGWTDAPIPWPRCRALCRAGRRGPSPPSLPTITARHRRAGHRAPRH
jgi:hypothetical protein